jgi:hypothetical protein
VVDSAFDIIIISIVQVVTKWYMAYEAIIRNISNRFPMTVEVWGINERLFNKAQC